MSTPKQYARDNDIPYTTVMTWLQRGLLPAAEKVPTPTGHYWLIPDSTPVLPPNKLGRPAKRKRKANKPH